MLCKKCESNIKSDFKYCPYCGERIVNDFHDQFQNLTPPFVIDDVQEIDDAAQFYAPAPGEQAPDLKVPSFAVPLHEEPEEPPYFVYHPDKQRPESKPSAGRAAQHPSAEKQELSMHEEKQEKRGVSLGFKLFLVFSVLFLALAVTFVGYQLMNAPEPFQNFDLSALFAAVYLMY